MTEQRGRSLRLSPTKINLAKKAVLKLCSQTQLAAKLGIAPAVVNKFFAGKPIESEHFSNICQYIHLDWQEVAEMPLETGAIAVEKVAIPVPETHQAVEKPATPAPETHHIETAPAVETHTVAQTSHVAEATPAALSHSETSSLVADELALEAIAPDAALALLEAKVGKNRLAGAKAKGFAAAASKGKKAKGKDKQAQVPQTNAGEKLCEILGYSPFSIELASRYLAAQPNLAIEKFIEQISKREAIASLAELIWQQLNADAQQLACIVSLFAAAPIPWQQVESVAGQMYLPGSFLQALLKPESSGKEVENLVGEIQQALESARNELERSRFLVPVANGVYSLPSPVREFCRTQLETLPNSSDLKQAFCQVMVAVAKQIACQPEAELIERTAAAIPHMAEAATAWQAAVTEADLISPFTGLSSFYWQQGDRERALVWAERGVAAVRDRLGATHLDFATSLNNLASLYTAIERYSEAEDLYLQALDLRKRLLGISHPAAIASLNALASLYDTQERYSEAQPLYLQALEQQQELLSAWHPQAAASLNNAAFLATLKGESESAASLYQQSLELHQKILGENHAATAINLSNLACLHAANGRDEEAEKLYLQALAIRKQIFGEKHPDVALSCNNLAYFYTIQARYAEAENLYLQSLEIRKQVLGENHPDVAISLNNLAFLYDAQERYSEAKPMLVQAIQISEQNLGKEADQTVTFLKNLANLQAKIGEQ